VALGVTAALMMPSSASATVRKLKFTSIVATGDYASLTVKVVPAARCTIKVTYDTVVSRAKGLGAKRGGTITWRWRVGTNTHPGRWPVKVDCGTSGTLSLRLRVVKS
jgi:hypothetical protein